MKNKLLVTTLRSVSLAVLYVFIVSQIMRNGEKLFGNLENSIVGPFAFLLLFVLSATIVGGLVFGQSVFLFLEGNKKESIKAAAYSIAWLGAFTIITLISLVLINFLK